MNDQQTLKLLVLHLLRDRALITSCRVDRSSQLNVNALTVQRGTLVPNKLQDATAVTLEIRTLDAVTVGNDAASDLDLELAVAFLMRVLGAGGERAEKLRRMFSWQTTATPRRRDGRVELAPGKKRLELDGGYIDVDDDDGPGPSQRGMISRHDARLLAGGESEPDVEMIDVDSEDQ